MLLIYFSFHNPCFQENLTFNMQLILKMGYNFLGVSLMHRHSFCLNRVFARILNNLYFS